MLDSHINGHFDLSKVMVFAKFYLYFNQCRLAAVERACLQEEVDCGSKAERKKIIAKVFAQNKSLVDTSALIDFLVDHLGSQTLIDPLTQEDPLAKLIDFYTKAEVLPGSQLTEFDKVSPNTVAKFVGN